MHLECPGAADGDGKKAQETQEAIAVIPPVKQVLSAELQVYLSKLKSCLESSNTVASSGFEAFKANSSQPEGEDGHPLIRCNSKFSFCMNSDKQFTRTASALQPASQLGVKEFSPCKETLKIATYGSLPTVGLSA